MTYHSKKINYFHCQPLDKTSNFLYNDPALTSLSINKQFNKFSMPIKNNAKKALRQAQKRAVSNKIVKEAYKTAVKNVRKAITAGEKDLTETARMAQKKLDKAAKKGVIKKNTAARKLSRIMKKVNLAK